MEAGCEEPVLFDYPTYEDAVIGMDSNGRVVYDYSRMIVSYIDKKEIRKFCANTELPIEIQYVARNMQ